MARLDDAQERLETAIERLQQAVQSQSERGNGDAAALENALTAIRTDYAALENRTEDVSQRLEEAIRRIKAMLED